MLELVLGGAASGKSEFAEAEALRLSTPHIYLATMRQDDRADKERIARHVKRREGTTFTTIECPVDIAKIADKVEGATVLLECMTNLAANELFPLDKAFYEVAHDGQYWNGRAGEMFDKIMQDIKSLYASSDNLIVVSGDVTRDGVKYGCETEAYIRLVAKLNAKLASMADRAYEVVYSCAKRIR